MTFCAPAFKLKWDSTVTKNVEWHRVNISYMSSCGIYNKNISKFTIRRGSQVLPLDRIVGNALSGACLKTNSVVCYCSFFIF